MIELPEAAVLAKQIVEAATGKRIKKVTAAKSPHRLAGIMVTQKNTTACLWEKLLVLQQVMAD